MGFLSGLFGAPKPVQSVVIKNVLGEVLLEIPGRRDLVGANLQNLNLAHAELSNVSLWAQCDGINLFGARLYRTDFQKASLRGAELAFSYAAGASFRGADLRECSLYRGKIGLSRRHSSADFTDALVNEATDIPERKVFGGGGCREGHTIDLLPSDRPSEIPLPRDTLVCLPSIASF